MRWRWHVNSRVLLVLILSVSLYAQSPPVSGSISGRVFDADTGEFLAGLHVGSREVGYSTTDNDGRYVIRGVMPQVVRINVREAGGGGMVTNDSISRRVAVTSNHDTSNVDLPVRIQGSISGRVLDADGNPLQGIRVLAISRQYSRDGGINGGREYSIGDPWYEQRSARFNVLTDDRGLYNIDQLYPGRNYWILAYSVPASRTTMNAVSEAPTDPQARRASMVATYYPGGDLIRHGSAGDAEVCGTTRERRYSYFSGTFVLSRSNPYRLRHTCISELRGCGRGDFPAEGIFLDDVPPAGNIGNRREDPRV